MRLTTNEFRALLLGIYLGGLYGAPARADASGKGPVIGASVQEFGG